MAETFACIIHPLNLDLLAEAFEKEIIHKREEIAKKILEWVPPFKCSDIEGIRSLQGRSVKGYLLSYTLLPEQILSLDSKFVLKKLINTGEVAEELGVKILGLAAYTSQIGRRGILIQRALTIPVTTGTNYTIAVVIESILKLLERLRIDSYDLTLTVVGASGNIGKIFTYMMWKYFKKIILVSRDMKKLSEIESTLEKKGCKRNKIIKTTNVKEFVQETDIMVTATNTPHTILDIKDLKPATIVCDISLPKNISKEASNTRDDVIVIDGGIVRPPGKPNFNFYFGLPKGLCYACMAEPIILTLEKKLESFSLGGNINEEKVREIATLANKHGFQLAEFRSFGEVLKEEKLAKFKKYLRK